MPDDSQRDDRGRFLTGTSGGGRPKGARSKLGQAFLEDLRDAWEAHRVKTLARCAIEQPAKFCSITASLLPKEVVIAALQVNGAAGMFDDYDLQDPRQFAAAYKLARQTIGAEPPMIDLNPEAEAAWRTDD